jgi:predicted RNA-binding protein with PIN domain
MKTNRTSPNRGQSLTYVIDGYNVIRRVDRLRSIEEQFGLERGRETLLRLISDSGVLSSASAIVVFDGRTGVYSQTLSVHSRINIRFSHFPQSADKVIISILRARADNGGVSVVTADRELEWAAMGLGARVLDPEDLMSSLTGGGHQKPGLHKPPVSTPEDVQRWLRVFGDGIIETEPRLETLRAASPEAPVTSSEAKSRTKERNRQRYLRRVSRQR